MYCCVVRVGCACVCVCVYVGRNVPQETPHYRRAALQSVDMYVQAHCGGLSVCVYVSP